MSPDPLLALVRRHDPDRFLACLFAPPERRGTLLVLCAFNHEIARAREVASEPTLALIRLQWWREVIEGARRQHEVAGPLGAALDEGRLRPAELLEMIEAREAETEPALRDRDAWETYLRGTAGALAAAAGHALGAEGALLERLRGLGMAYGVAGQLRSFRLLARQGRCLLPEDMLAGQGLSVAEAIARPAAEGVRAIRAHLAQYGRELLAQGAGGLPRPVLAAALPAVLARRDLRDPEAAPGPRGLGDRLAVLRAAVLGRV
ncbi:conserved protein of unknown function [Rhodovastum atsumiense]|uniref:Squalene/phytoene synthase family protein n=1 Tax=Rhodovastum atsumiense TaxID=504468 RepID=A0A5M6IMU2_9PROT|nr:squalene/phytoene synthase family protein [Rhodovastum atsumiense]KAA5609287.1 hypothetical protein F1189_24845 [Rhodovastum atsumiense]CAH2604586.1 conserved protein of unknown function [Rhodovastum atsumiense]